MGSTKKGEIIPQKLYRKILEVLPVPCVDVVVVHNRKFLLCKRKNKPEKGKWWLIGGRVLKNETLEGAALRKVREEAGIKNSEVKKFLANKSMVFRDSEFGPSTHSINSVFLVDAQSSSVVVPDKQSSKLAWFSKIERKWPSYVKKMLVLAGF